MSYYVKVTTTGQTKLADAVANQTPLQITHFAVGDANGAYYEPTGNEVALVHEVWRATVNRVYRHPNNPSWIVVEAIIPASQGGFDIREAGAFDGAGAMIAIGKYPLTTKPAPGSGSEKDLYVRLIMQVANVAAVDQTIDPSLIMATQEYVDRKNVREACRVATTANSALAGLLTVDGVELAENDRVLVKNQGTASQNGIYVATAGAWSRSLDFDNALEVTDTMIVAVREGTANADTIWMLSTNAPITVGTTGLTFIKIYPDESSRTISDANAPTGDAGTPTTLFGWLGYMVKAITGKATWRTAPATTLEAAKGHMDAAAPHAGHQPIDPTLTALAALVTAADKIIYATGADAFATTTLSAFIRTLLDDADAATARATLGAAPLDSPGLTGIPTAPTAAGGTSTTQLANTAFVQAAIAALVNGASGSLDQLNELATAMGNDPNFSTTMINALAGKQPIDPTLTALAALGTAADKLIYATGADTFSTATLTAFMRTLLDDADAAAARETLGLAIPNQTWQDLTATRASGTAYTNATGHLIYVSVHINNGAITPAVGGVALGIQGSANNNTLTMYSFPVPPGASYSVTCSGGFIKWVELR